MLLSVRLKVHIYQAFLCLLVGKVLAGDATPQEVIIDAAKALDSCTNYTWKTRVAAPERPRFRAGPMVGKQERDGYIYITMGVGDDIVEAVCKGDTWVATNPNGEWRFLDDLNHGGGPRSFVGRTLQNFRLPAEQVADLVAEIQDLKEEGDEYSGTLSSNTTAAFLIVRRRDPDTDRPAVQDAQGTATFWIKDGLIQKYEVRVSGKVGFERDPMPVERTTLVEIRDVNTTVLDVPVEAQAMFKRKRPASDKPNIGFTK